VTADLVRRLEQILDDLIRRKDIHSVVLRVASGNGDLDWAGARGVQHPHGPAMTPDTPFFTASITKLFIAAVVMRLVEEGSLALTDRLPDHLPREVVSGLHTLDGVDRTGEITIQHLLAHASGLPDYIEDFPAASSTGTDRRSLVEILVEEGDRSWSLRDTAHRIREGLRPHFPPQDLTGERVRIRYSDTNYQLLMGIVETVRGEPFPAVLHELILEPLGLRHTWIPEAGVDAGEGRRAATIWFKDQIVSFPRFFASIGDLNATAGDLIHFLRSLVEGQFFRKAETWPRMQARWHRFRHPLDRAALRQPSWPIEYGLGVMRFQLPRFLTPLRPLPPVIGHTGSTGTWLFHVPELDVYLVGAANQITAGPVPFRVVPKLLRSALDSRTSGPAA
jgi:D-alanyl-D-alanine carboxypeptidase